MKMLIVGENAQNARVAEYFEQKGFETQVLTGVGLKAFSGQVGSFAAKTAQGTLTADFVVLTQPPGEAPPDIGGGKLLDLYTENKPAKLSLKDRTAPVVFLLDWFCESPMAATLAALADAKQLAGLKRKVYYLARFVRTAGHEAEALYQQARRAGVSFIKYETLDIAFNDDTAYFDIKASDGVLDFAFSSPTVFAHGGRGVGAPFARLAKTLNLWPDEKGYLQEDRYFLVPVFTSRRGVFALSREVLAERFEDGLGAIHAAALAEGLSAPEKTTAQVNGDKCVLCYSCYRACPHAAMVPSAEARKMDNLQRACEGCGICAGVCPGNAITLGAQNAAANGNKAKKTLLLCCENSAEIAARTALPALGALAANVDVQSMPCGGAVSLEDLAAALQGYGRVMVAVCHKDACRHFDGNERACRQAQRLQGMLLAMGMDARRVGTTHISHAMPLVLRDELAAFMAGGAGEGNT